MDAPTSLAVFQIGIGICILAAAVVLGIRLKAIVPKTFYYRWAVAVSLVSFFLAGYSAYLYVLVHDIRFPAELVTGTMFLGGAVFVYVVIRLTETTLRTLSEENRVRRELLEQLELRTASLIEANEDLEREFAAQKVIERALKESEDKYRSLVESTDDSIYVVDSEGCYTYMNRKHLSRLAVSWEEVIGHPYADFHDEGQTAAFKGRIDRVFTTGKSHQSEYRSLRDGNHFLQTFSPVRNAAGSVTAVTVVSKNITDRKKMEDELRHFSFTDELTGLTNRRGFFALAEHRLKLAHRLGEKHFILYIDLDNLKTINDSLGHQEGDVALVETARILKTTFRESDIIARIGGDEFVVGPSSLDGKDPSQAASRLNTVLSTVNEQSGRAQELSLSIGHAVFDPQAPCSIDELLATADRSMYEEKTRKRTAGS